MVSDGDIHAIQQHEGAFFLCKTWRSVLAKAADAGHLPTRCSSASMRSVASVKPWL